MAIESSRTFGSRALGRCFSLEGACAASEGIATAVPASRGEFADKSLADSDQGFCVASSGGEPIP